MIGSQGLQHCIEAGFTLDRFVSNDSSCTLRIEPDLDAHRT
jgi:hypothetical protein